MATVWMQGDPEPGREVDTVGDVDGDQWERWMSDDDTFPDLWSVPGHPEVMLNWRNLAANFWPLTDATMRTVS